MPLAALTKKFTGPGLRIQPDDHVLRLGQIPGGPGRGRVSRSRVRLLRRGWQEVRKTAMFGGQSQKAGADRLLPELFLRRGRTWHARLLQSRAQGRNLGFEPHQHSYISRRQAVVQFGGAGTLFGLIQ